MALADRRHRAARLPADRPRPERGQPVVARARDRDGRQGGDGRARAGRVPEDLRRDRAAHPRADQAGARRSRTCATSRRRWRRRSSGAIGDQASRRRRGRSPTASACSSTTARTRATGRSRRAYSIRPTPGRARLGAADAGTRCRDCDPATFTLQTMRERIAEVGDLTAGMWRRKVEPRVPRFEQLGLEAAVDRRGRPGGAGGGRTSRQVHCSGSLSSRKRSSRVPWRKRLPCTLS